MKVTLLNLRFFGEGAQADADAAQGGSQGTAADAEKNAGQAASKPTADAGESAAASGKDPGKAPQAAAPEQAEQPGGVDFREVLSRAALTARIRAAEAAAARWEKEAEDLKQIYPFFSLEHSLRADRGFVSLLKAGVPVRLAFEAANLEKILGAAMRYAAGTAGKRTVQSILAGTGRVRENPVLDRASSVRKKDVGSLTDREIMKILQQVSNGEKITF